MDNVPDLSLQRSPFNHAPFLCTLCCYQRKAHDEPDAPVQMIYSTKSVLQMIMEHAFVEPARKIDLIEAVRDGAMSKLRAKLHLTDVDINSGDCWSDRCGQTVGQTAVYRAVHSGNTEALKLLLQYGGDPNSAAKNGDTPVHMAAHNTGTKELEVLLPHGGDPNRANKYGLTPVHIAADRGRTEALQLLLHHGGDPNRSGKFGATPVSMATNNANTEAVAILKAAGGKY